MYDACPVGRIQRVSNLDREFDRFCWLQGTFGDDAPERYPGNEFHRDDVGIFSRECVEDGDNIRMDQGSSAPCFTKEAVPRRGRHEPGLQCLQRDKTAQMQVPRLEDLPHRALADPLDDFEMV